VNVHLEQGYYFNPYGKTKAAKRKVPLSARAAAIVHRRLAAAKGEYLFPGGRGANEANKPLVKVNGAHAFTLARLAKSEENKVKKFRLYDLRHTWATRAAMSGVDIVTLAAMLGHSRVQMVMRYAHPTEEHQFDAMKKMQEHRAAKAKKA
jgi:integrase/recombinase XerC